MALRAKTLLAYYPLYLLKASRPNTLQIFGKLLPDVGKSLPCYIENAKPNSLFG
jgi:hypothetical protein